MIISANRDESVFDRPDDLDLGRDPNRHLTFAFGKHFCLGNQLARLEGQIAIGELVRRFPEMRLAVPREDAPFKPVQALRGFRSLPVASTNSYPPPRHPASRFRPIPTLPRCHIGKERTS